MPTSLFDRDHTFNWPEQKKFPINEPFEGREIKPILLKDIESSEQFLIITGFTSLRNIIEIFGARDFTNLRKLRVVIGFEPEERVGKYLPHYSVTTEIKNFWLKQGISIKDCGSLLNVINKIDTGFIDFKVINKLHSKIYVGDNSAMLGSSNFSKLGITTQREANIRVIKSHKGIEGYQYESIKQIAENYFSFADDYNKDIRELFKKLLKDADWQEALARALSEILESKWMKDYPQLYKAIVDSELWPSQKIGIAKAMKIIQDQGNLLLADPTGSGKTKLATVLAYTIFHWLAENGFKNRSNALIIAPKQILENWESEQKHFILFNKIESMGKLSNSKGKKIEQLQSDIENTDILLIDEAHSYLRWNSKRSSRINPKKSAHVILSTATPINKKSDDLLRLIELLDIDNLNDVDLEEYLRLRKQRNKRIDPEHLSKLKRYINQFIVRRTKKELNQMIDREPEAYKNSNGHRCRYPEAIIDIYSTNETDEDKKIASKITELLSQLKGINYLQKFTFLKYLETDTEKKQFLNHQFKSAPALAGFEIKSSLRSSKCALIEYLFGTDAAKIEFNLDVKKSESGNILLKLKKCRDTAPKISFPYDWLQPENRWIVDSQQYLKVCEDEISIHEEIGILTRRLSDNRELAKINKLVEIAEKDKKVIAFDSTVITLSHLEKLLQKTNTDSQIIVATGQNEKNIRIVKDLLDKTKFNSNSKCIALCSDVMSESINLPGARAVMLLDMPSVLRVIEQRIGRIERMDSEHKEIYIHWPNDAKEFSLQGDRRLIKILNETKKLIGNNVVYPQMGIFEEYLTDENGAEDLINAYKKYSETEPEWEEVKDNTQQLYKLIGKEGLISEKLYEEYKDIDVTVKTAISFVESNTTWSFFAFRGTTERSPKWLLIDEKGKPLTDFSEICDKLKILLSNNVIIQRRWNEVNSKEVIQKLIHQLRKLEREILPPKKQRALRVAERLLDDWYEHSVKEDIPRKELIRKVKDLFKPEDNNENIVDYDNFAELWLFILLPVIDAKRKNQRKKRTIFSLKDLTYKDITLSNNDLEDILEKCHYTATLDELVASCIIAVNKEI